MPACLGYMPEADVAADPLGEQVRELRSRRFAAERHGYWHVDLGVRVVVRIVEVGSERRADAAGRPVAHHDGEQGVALAVVVIFVARAARRSEHARAGLAAAAFGIAVAGISRMQLTLSAWLLSGLVPDRQAATAGTV